MPKKRSDYRVLTKGDWQLDIVASGLQIAIRREKEEEALFWAEELFASGFQRYLLYRLWIIADEVRRLGD